MSGGGRCHYCGRPATATAVWQVSPHTKIVEELCANHAKHVADAHPEATVHHFTKENAR